MISISNKKIDLILQVEDYTSINKIYSLLTLDVDSVLVICPDLFLQRFVQHICDSIDSNTIESIEDVLKHDNGFCSIKHLYKNKEFTFNFIILSSESKIVNNPFKGEQIFKVGFKEIKI